MLLAIKIIFLISLFIFFSLKKYPLIITLGGITLLFGLFFLRFSLFSKGLFMGLTSLSTYQLMFLIWITVAFTAMIDGEGIIKSASDMLLKSVRNPVFLFPFFPALIGLFPMPGGALVSAPMLKKMTKGSGLPPETEAVINFWFRHIWESVWILYPGIIILSSKEFLNTSVMNIVSHQYFLMVFAFLGGFVFLLIFNSKKIQIVNRVIKKANIVSLLVTLWPIVFLVIGVVLLPKGLFYLILLILFLSILFTLQKRISVKSLLLYAKKGFNLKLILLIPIIYIFKFFVEYSTIKDGVLNIVEAGQVPLEIILFLVPMFFGLLFGLTIGTISLGFPIISFIFLTQTGEINFYYFTIFFLGGYIGLLFSPMHLCLLVTKEYFNTNLMKMYGKMVLPGIFLTIFSLIANYFLNR
ncbi:DUF401 family protein [bacterium]|nr:DUF401 family protein [bacterium]